MCIAEVMILTLLTFSAKDPKRKTLAKELEEEESLLRQCIEKLKLVEASRVALVSQLKEALHEQVCYHVLLFKKFLYLSTTFGFQLNLCSKLHFLAILCGYLFQESELESICTQMQVCNIKILFNRWLSCFIEFLIRFDLHKEIEKIKY